MGLAKMKGTIMKKEGRKEFLKHKALFLLFLIPFCLTVSSKMFLTAGDQPGSPDESTELSKSEINEIEEYIRSQMKRGKIPGLSVVIVKEDKTIYKNGFGYANIKKKQPVTAKTLFEIGSNSKAFTALGILWLKVKSNIEFLTVITGNMFLNMVLGVFEPVFCLNYFYFRVIDLNDPVDKYIPWFKMKYKGKEVSNKESNKNLQITIEQLLHHTSGIPFETVADIPQSGEDNALEETVRTLINKELSYKPGTEFSFATINYDVLGLIIEKVSGQSFEEFIKNNILEPLELTDTYLSRNEAMAHEMATGYKIEFLKAQEYKAPVYRGNTPAGYFITNSVDMERWLKIQMGTIELSEPLGKIIHESHQPNEKVIGFRYAKGWFIFKKREIFHSGNNPNFSSFIVLFEPGKIGIALLANINSGVVEETGWGILSIIKKEGMPVQSKDFYIKLDMISFIVACIAALLILLSIWFIYGTVKEVLKKTRTFKRTRKNSLSFFAATLLLIGILYFLFELPTFLSYDLPWKVINVWAPKTLKMASFLLGVTGFLFYIYFFFNFFFPKSQNNMNTLEDKK